MLNTDSIIAFFSPISSMVFSDDDNIIFLGCSSTEGVFIGGFGRGIPDNDCDFFL